MGYGTKEFMSKVRTGGFGKMSDWKKRGKTVGWIHLDGFRERKMHNMMITKFKTKEGKEGHSQRMFVCPGGACPLCALVEFAKDSAEGLGEEKDFQVLYRSIKAKEKRDPDRVISYSMKELAGKGDWRHKMFPNTEFLFGWVPRDNRIAEAPVEIMQATTALATAIKRVIQSQIEDRGERNGDPMVKPYALKFTYNKDAIPAQMFNAERVDGDLAPLDEDVLEILKTPLVDLGSDLDKMVQPNSRSEILDSIEDCWDEDCPVAFDEFHDFYSSLAGGDRDGKTEREKKMEKATDRRDQMHGRGRAVSGPADRESKDGDGGEGLVREDPDEDRPRSSGRSAARSRSAEVEDRPMGARELAGELESTARASRGRSPGMRMEQSQEEPEVERPKTSRRQAAQDHRAGFSVDEVAPEPEDEPPKTSGRRKASDADAEEPKKAGKALVMCKTCGDKVVPSRFGKCPECASELDVPF